MDERYELLHSAISAIAARCDGAVDKDGVGFNGLDTKFGRSVSQMSVKSWTSDIAAEVARILPVYRKQLEAYGIDYAALRDVIRAFEDAPDNRTEARQQARESEYRRNHAPYITFSGDMVLVWNSYPIKDDLKKNGFRYDPCHKGEKAWGMVLNGTSALTVLGLGVNLTDEQRAILESQEPEEHQIAQEQFNIDVDGDRLFLRTDWGQIALDIIRAIPGREWVGSRKINWISPHIGLYALAEEYGLTISDKAREIIESHREEQEAEQAAKKAVVAESFATDTDMAVALGDRMRSYQKAGAAYAIRHQRALIADEMGLGKTWQALSAVETIGAYPCLVVCPPSLRFNWRREISNLLPGRTVNVYEGRNSGDRPLPKSDIHVVSYATVASYLDSLPELGSLVCDESHYIKNEDADRTRAILKLTGHGFRKVKKDGKITRVPVDFTRITPETQILMLTGTPVLNRPNELVQPLVSLGYLNTFGKGEGSVSWFLFRFCHDHDKCNGYGHVFTGAKNTEELHEWLRITCMVGRSKADVMSELPPKIRAPQFIVLDDAARQLYLKLAQEGAEKAADSRAEALVYLNALRKAVGDAKIRLAVEWANDFLETGKSLVVFANHKAVQRGIISGLRELGHEVVHILGAQSGKETEEAKRAFQAREANVIVVSLSAGREGHTLTAASDVLLVEQGWNPGTQDQAEDRCHRIGQEDSVTIWYLIAQDTIDEWIYELVESKRKVVNLINRGISVEQGEESVFNEVLERALATYGGGNRTSRVISELIDEDREKEEKVTTCEGCGEINLCLHDLLSDRWLCSECGVW